MIDLPRPDFEESHPIEVVPRRIIEDEPIIEEVGTSDHPRPVEESIDRDEIDNEDELVKK